jgi:redox-sensitive bicupin YhaK (pirin superfamily)
VPVEPEFEYALVVTAGSVSVDGETVSPGHLAYLGTGRHELTVSSGDPARALVLGGTPFPEQILMWWNFVARTRDEIDDAFRDWSDETGRFGTVRSGLARVEVGPPSWAPRS